MFNRVGDAGSRELKRITLDSDLIVIGGGVAGCCGAITAARQGLKVVLAQDRPVLGGNASSEIRLWILGATCHMESNNRWAREGGIIDEILVENLFRNPEGNALILDTILLEWVHREQNITLLLNTAVFEVTKHPEYPDRIAAVCGFCSQNSTMYDLRAPLFCDASGDGIVGFCAGAAFRMGAEPKEEFDEEFAPSGEFGALLGHSMYFYSKDVGRPVTFQAPSFALKNVPELIPRFRSFNTREQGCQLWWIEWGGRLDTVHDTEQIKWELWRVIYGVWDYIKNSGKFPDASTLALEWVSHIPGKRESRRFESDYMLSQRDIVNRKLHDDAVAFGGWSIDLHPAEGVFSSLAGSHHLHSKGPYQIPYRCYYSRNVSNLFLAGRIISSSHVAFGSTRVIATCAVGAQAVGHAAAVCHEAQCLPREICEPKRMQTLQRRLCQEGHIWSLRALDPNDLALIATVAASSRLLLGQLSADGPTWSLKDADLAQLMPLPQGAVPTITLSLDSAEDTKLTIELVGSSRDDHNTPDEPLASRKIAVRRGRNVSVSVDFQCTISRQRYVFLILRKNEHIAVQCTSKRLSGFVSLFHAHDEHLSHIGGDDYELWIPTRRPMGHNFAMTLSPPLDLFGPANVVNGWNRPHLGSVNVWMADYADPSPELTITWSKAQIVGVIVLHFDVDYEHAMESCLRGHPERVMPFCVKGYRLLDDKKQLVHKCEENHQARNVICLETPRSMTALTLQILTMNAEHMPATVFSVRCFPPGTRV